MGDGGVVGGRWMGRRAYGWETRGTGIGGLGVAGRVGD